MNIQPISLVRNTPEPTTEKTKMLAFKGLWGNSETESDGTEFHDWFTETKHYYPFSDESQSDIDNIAKEHTFSQSGYYTSAYPEYTYDHEYKVVVESRLPIKMAEWAKFVSNKFSLPAADRNFIEQLVKRLNLRAKL